MLSTKFLCAILCNYQNALMYISEPKVNQTPMNHANKVYELEKRPLGLIG